MPLPERVIQPVNISRGTLQCPVPDELEGVTNGTLANIIRQLSSLSRHAEEMFGNLFKDAENIANRSSSLQARIDRLAIRVTQLDSTVEEVSLQDIQLRKVFRSSQSFDQQVVSRETMPKAMLEVYLSCDKPPPLDKLNPYREDGKDGLKFYTDPNYFFDLWRQEMTKGTERMMNDRGKKHPGKVQANGVAGNGAKSDRHKKRVRQPTNTTERQRLKAIGQGEYLMSPTSTHPDFMQSPPQQQQQQQLLQQQEDCFENNAYAVERPRPNSIEIKRTYNSQNNYNSNHLTEPIYMPRILRNEQSGSPTYTDGPPNYTRRDFGRTSGGLMVDQLQQQQRQMEQQQQLQPQIQQQPQQYFSFEMRSGGTPPTGSPSKRRPTQPPPAPPPGATPPGGGSTPIRGNSTPRETNNNTSLPLPPPPLLQQQLIQEVTTVVQNGLNHESSDKQTSQSSNEMDLLPPPPPAPASADKLAVNKVSQSHLAPSPPPPPPAPASQSNDVLVVSPKNEAAPPPPPPPPPNGLNNGDIHSNHKGDSPSKSPVKNSILSPPGLRKPTPLYKPPLNTVRSDLLKAIRDGIALKKVEQRAAAEHSCDATDESAGQTDVASILARRVAVEMSDSDDGPSDSECDSDDWGDESTA